MEPASENSRVRGRPRAFSVTELHAVNNGINRSTRQLQSRAYAERGRHRLGEWAGESGEYADYPVCVLEQIGRIDDSALFREAATWYMTSGQDMTAKRSAERLRRLRVGARSSVSTNPSALYEKLLREIDDHRLTYPGTGYEEVKQAAVLALTVIRKTWPYVP